MLARAAAAAAAVQLPRGPQAADARVQRHTSRACSRARTALTRRRPLVLVRAAQEEKPDGSGSGSGSETDGVSAAFFDELKRRGMSQGGEQAAAREGGEASPSPSGSQQQPRAPPPQPPRWAEDQLERSRALNSEGLEGLIPRATELIKLGITSVAPFAPFILVIALLFTATYQLFGSDFIHGGELYGKGPGYVVPEGLLAEPTVDRMVPFDRA